MEERLPQAFLARMREELGEDGLAAYLAAMREPPVRALRVNTLKIAEESFRRLVDFTIKSVGIADKIELSDRILDDIANNDIMNSVELVKSSENMANNTSNAQYIEISDVISDDNTNKSSRIIAKIEESSKNAEDIANSSPICYCFPDSVAIGKHPLHAAGLCYVQEPSAQVPARLLGVSPGMTVLDLCAAPGGKSGQLAAMMGNTGLLIANEPVPARANVLVNNLERLGVHNAVVTAMYPDALTEKLAGLCDAVLVDAPCSGEGMFRRDAGAIADWSVAHVQACAARQRAILDAADMALRDGGALVYSTCTFSREENEDTVDAFLAAHPAYTCEVVQRLYPHTSAGEGQFMAKLRKRGGASVNGAEAERRARRSAAERPRKPIPPWEAFCADTFAVPPAGQALLLPDGRVLLPPEGYDALPSGLRVLRAGVLLGEIRQGRFTPAHALAMALPAHAFLRSVPLAGRTLADYLAGETVPCEPALSGWCAATFAGHPLGFGKAVGGTLKNHLPKGLRIRG